MKVTKEAKPAILEKKKVVEREKKNSKESSKTASKGEDSLKAKVKPSNSKEPRSDGAKSSEKLHLKPGVVAPNIPAPGIAPTVSGTPTVEKSVSVPSPSVAAVTALENFVRIEKSGGNKATLVVSGPKIGSKIKITITSKVNKK